MTSNRAKHAVALVLPALMLAMAGKPAMAQPTYDKKIAKATADIVSQKLGDIRGSLSIGDQPVMLPDLMRTHSIGRAGMRSEPGGSRPAEKAPRPLEAADLTHVRVVLPSLH